MTAKQNVAAAEAQLATLENQTNKEPLHLATVHLCAAVKALTNREKEPAPAKQPKAPTT